MKDYYQILGVPEDCSEADIKKAFRKLAFQHHPDTNPGREKEAEARFKEINEAYGVLGDRNKRQQYDFTRKGQFAGAGYPGSSGFPYSQQDIFNGIFSNAAMFDEMNRMFAQAGLRFDQDFLNRVFFSGRGFTFRVYTSPGGNASGFYGNSPVPPAATAYKPGWMERMLTKAVGMIGRFVLKRLLGPQYQTLSGRNLDHHVGFEITPAEAASGGEKQVTYQRQGKLKKLVVKVPSGIKPGTRIRLKGMGMREGRKSGDLYLHVRIKG